MKRNLKMKEMYIVWNLTNYGDGYEFFGICETLKEADKLYSKICDKYGFSYAEGFDEENSIIISKVKVVKSK